MIYGAISNAISNSIGEMLWGIAKGLLRRKKISKLDVKETKDIF